MHEKQTYTQGPNKLTHIEVRKARLMRTKAAIGGLAVGMSTMAAAIGILGHTTESNQPEEKITDNTAIDIVPRDPVEVKVETLTIKNGDTLWGIAERVNSDSDPRSTIIELEKANPSMSPGTIQPGEVVRVPVDISDHDLTQ